MPVIVFVSISRCSIKEILRFGNAIVMALIGLGAAFVSFAAIARFARDDEEITIIVVNNSSFMSFAFFCPRIAYALLGQGALGSLAARQPEASSSIDEIMISASGGYGDLAEHFLTVIEHVRRDG